MIRTFLLTAALASMPLASADDAAEPANQTPDPWQVRDGAVIDFTVLRKGNRFGTHRLAFELDEDGTLNVATDVELKVNFGPVTVYRYELDSQETWKDGKLVRLEGKANKDGEREQVSAVAKEGALVVDGSEFSGELDLPVIPSSHWNRLQVYSDRMLSTESGEVIDIDVTRLGEETVMVGDKAVPATRYRVDSDIDVDLWYDDQSRWVKLAFEARGQQIEYVLNSLY